MLLLSGIGAEPASSDAGKPKKLRVVQFKANRMVCPSLDNASASPHGVEGPRNKEEWCLRAAARPAVELDA